MPRIQEAPIHLKHNPYRGPNAHLLSLQQTPDRDNAGLWHSFHSAFIVYIVEWLNANLPEGYSALSEQSLQIAISFFGGDDRLPPRVPDATVYREQTYHPTASAQHMMAIAAPDAVIPVQDDDLDTTLDAVVIYSGVSHLGLGEPILRVELLSPANKRGGSGLVSYRCNRRDCIRSGVRLYELDLLHESASPLDEIPVYPKIDRSHPYYIAVTDPTQPELETRVKFFNVDDPFPLVNILLRGDDLIRDFDFGIPYNYNFERSIWGKLLDYADDPDPTRQHDTKASLNRDVPPALAAYSPADQARIAERMRAIIAAETTS